MRSFLVSATASILVFSAPAFAQNATQNAEPVLIDQGNAQPASTASNPADDGSTAFAQAPPPGPNLTPWVVGGLAVGGIVTVVVVASNNNNNDNNNTTTKSNPASP